MAIIYFSGFEVGAAAVEGTVSGTAALVTSPVKNGTYALRCNPTTTNSGVATLFGFIYPTAGPTFYNSPTIYATFWFRADLLPSADDEIIARTLESDLSLKLEIRITSAGILKAYNAAATLIATGTTVLSTETWYRIGVKCGSHATAAAWEVTINGVTEFGGLAALSADNNGALQVGKGTDRNGESVDFFYDDVVVSDSSYIGDQTTKVVLARPTANGATMAWTAGTGASDYTQVDEVPPSDADYIQSTAQNDVALFAMQDAATIGVAGAIQAVAAIVRVIRAGASNGTILVRMRSGATDVDTNTAASTASVTSRVLMSETDPATSAAWTTNGIDGLQVGLVDSEATDRTRCTAVYITVLLTAGIGQSWVRAYGRVAGEGEDRLDKSSNDFIKRYY